MASPQIENGFTPIADEILEALMRVSLSGSEWQVILAILRKTYGFQKICDWISLSQFGKMTGMDRRNVHRTIKKLSSKQMIVIQSDDKGHPIYQFQKDYEQWQLSSKQTTTNCHPDRRQLSSKQTTKVSSKQTHTINSITKDNIFILFNFWNDQKIIKHRKLDSKTETTIRSALKDYKIEEIKDAIVNYKFVNESEEHYFSHKWTLLDFLNRGLRKFLNEADPRNNYLGNSKFGNQRQTQQAPIECF